MSETKRLDDHIGDARLWQWRNQELEEASATSVQQHLQSCRLCQQRAETINRLIGEMQLLHRSAQPTLAEQMQLLRTLESQFISAEPPNVLITTSRQLIRLLVPAVAILAMLLILLRHETPSSSDTFSTLLAETPESRLLTASTDEQFQQALLELAFSESENER
jgi:hypothetical protein